LIAVQGFVTSVTLGFPKPNYIPPSPVHTASPRWLHPYRAFFPFGCPGGLFTSPFQPLCAPRRKNCLSVCSWPPGPVPGTPNFGPSWALPTYQFQQSNSWARLSPFPGNRRCRYSRRLQVTDGLVYGPFQGNPAPPVIPFPFPRPRTTPDRSRGFSFLKEHRRTPQHQSNEKKQLRHGTRHRFIVS